MERRKERMALWREGKNEMMRRKDGEKEKKRMTWRNIKIKKRE